MAQEEKPEKTLLTSGGLARILQVPTYKVTYLILARQITPQGRAGHVRVFSDDVLDLLRQEIGDQPPVLCEG